MSDRIDRAAGRPAPLRERQPRPPLTPQPRPRRVPVSYGQEQLWFLDRLEKGSTQYTMLQPWRLRGPLDTGALRAAVNAVVERHESLRTRFAELDGEPSQIIARHLEIGVPVEDLRGLGRLSQTERVAEALREERETPFDLARGPLLRARLLRLDDADHVFLRSVHHIVFDGWSQEIFNRELATLFEAFSEGRANPLPPLGIQYADFAIWQRRWLAGQELAGGVAYWKARLAALPDRLELPADRARPATQTYHGGVHEAALSGPALAGVRALTSDTQATLNMVLLAAFGVLLSRYSGQEDIAVGTPAANRTDFALEPLIGFFVNTLAMRMRVRREITARELVAAVRQNAVEGYHHQDVPFSRVVAELAPRRQLNVPPVVQVLFAMHRRPPAESRLGHLVVEPVRSDDLPVRYDLELHAFEDDGKLSFYWVYNTDLFDRWRIEQMARHYSHLLDQLGAHPDRALGEMQVLPEDERWRMLHGWNDPVAADGFALPEKVSNQAGRTPDATAIVCERDVLTYRALETAANRLAHALMRRGVGPGHIVGLACRRGCGSVVVLLGVVKTGAAYLPLDPTCPRARLALMIEEAVPPLLLVDGDTGADLPGVPQLDLGSPSFLRELSRMPATPPAVPDRRSPRDLAYVLYTSGSTGTPKGVMVEQGALASFAAAVTSPLPFAENDRHVAVTNLTFDISLFDLLLPLSQGAQVIVAGGEEVRDAGHLRTLLRGASATSLQITPSHLAVLAQHEPEALCGVRVLAGGEPFPAGLSRTLCAAGADVWNGYGPTEATVYTTLHHVRRGELDEPRGSTVPIGRRLPNARIYVLGAGLEPVPIGVPGELHIGGAAVGRGYLARPDWTGDRFLPDPYGAPASRMYRTGDLVRWRPDGSLEFLGRTDLQVKVRGFRIELGEIESRLREHESVGDAIVVARGEADARVLVAYVIPRQGAVVEALRLYLQRHLPVYMVPSFIELVDEWPLTPHGKIDRAALSERAPMAPPRTAPIEEPDGDEATLRALFADVLQRTDVGRDDDFFALGGQSLLATRLVNRIRVRMGVDVDVRTVFETPTVRGLAASLQRNTQETGAVDDASAHGVPV
ncbi:MAG: non-ribosomal peptide synthetase [Vicinamibacterales bacterium]